LIEQDQINLRQKLLRLILPKIIDIIDKDLIKDIENIIEKSRDKIKYSDKEIDFDSLLSLSSDKSLL
jgi:hypothetical protein